MISSDFQYNQPTFFDDPTPPEFAYEGSNTSSSYIKTKDILVLVFRS